MNKENFVNENGPTMSTNLSKERKKALNKIVKINVFFCSIHDVDFQTFTEEHEHGVRKPLAVTGNFLVAGSPCKAQMDKNNMDAANDVFDSYDMVDTTKVLRDVMKPDAHWHVFLTLYNLFFSIKLMSTT